MDRGPGRLPWPLSVGFSGESTGVGFHAFSPGGIIPTQASNLHLLGHGWLSLGPSGVHFQFSVFCHLVISRRSQPCSQQHTEGPLGPAELPRSLEVRVGGSGGSSVGREKWVKRISPFALSSPGHCNEAPPSRYWFLIDSEAGWLRRRI